MTDTPYLDKLARIEDELRLAVVPVRQFTRLERGREQVVRQHSETTTGTGVDKDIPQADWLKGQQVWKQRGEAAWKSAGAMERASNATAEARRDAQQAAQRTTEVTQARPPVRSRSAIASKINDAAQDAASRGRPALERTGEGSQRQLPSSTKGFSLQQHVENMETERQSIGRRLSNNPLFGGPEHTPGSIAPMEQAIHDAADRAVMEAAIRSGIFNPDSMSSTMQELGSMEDKLHQLQGEVKTEVKQEVDTEVAEQGRAVMALNILGIVAGILVAALTGGIGSSIAAIMVGKWLFDVAKELAVFHGVIKQDTSLRRVAAHPGRATAHAGQAAGHVAHKVASKTASKTKKVAARSSKQKKSS